MGGWEWGGREGRGEMTDANKNSPSKNFLCELYGMGGGGVREEEVWEVWEVWEEVREGGRTETFSLNVRGLSPKV